MGVMALKKEQMARLEDGRMAPTVREGGAEGAVGWVVGEETR